MDHHVDFVSTMVDRGAIVIPEPPDQSFASDNAAGAHPRVIEALSAANAGSAAPYGDDAWTQRATRKFGDLLEADVEVLFTYGGTGANMVALQSMLAPHEAVICPSTAHINVDECGAPERFTGAKLIDIPSEDGKLHPKALVDLLGCAHGEHNVKPKVLVISQVTELGTVYTIDETTHLAEFAHAHGLLLFMDGARIANASAALGCSLRALSVDAGVDVLTFGGTKNGLVYGDAVIYLRPELAARARFARKQAGQLASKMRFIAAQFDALLTDQLWLDNARHANHTAALLAERVVDTPHVELNRAPHANSVFAQIPAHAIEPLRNWSFFWTWDAPQHLVRWMTSFATTQVDVARFAEGVKHFTAPLAPSTTPLGK
jgi:threonine aldolase